MNYAKRGSLFVPSYDREWSIPPSEYKSVDRYRAYMDRRRRELSRVRRPQCLITYVSKSDAFTAAISSSRVYTLTQTVAAGNFLVVVSRIISITAGLTVTNDVGQTAQQALVQSDGTRDLFIHYFENCGAATTVTVAPSLLVSQIIAVLEFSVVNLSGSIDQTKSGTGTGSGTDALTSGATSSTLQAAELIIGGVELNSTTTVSPGTGFSSTIALSPTGAGNNLVAAEYQIVSTAGAQTATFTTSVSKTWSAGVATFRANIVPIIRNQYRQREA